MNFWAAARNASIASAVAAVVSAAVIPLLLSRSRRRGFLLDRPNPRSSHVVPTPRGGGLGIGAGFLAGIAVLALLGPIPEHARSLAIAFAALAGMGLLDDLRSLPVLPRLALQVLAAVLAALEIGTIPAVPLPAPLDFPLGALALPATVVWIVGVLNFFNFMDGIDGLAGGQAIATCIGVIAAGWSGGSSSFAFVLAGAVLGFLLYNWPPARIFMGDVGSIPIGFLLAALPLLAPADARSPAVLAVGIGMALFLLDPLFTLLRRFRGARRIGEAHREHAYQRLLSPGESHRRVTTALVLSGLLLSSLGALAFRMPAARWPAVAIALIAYTIESAFARRIESRR